MQRRRRGAEATGQQRDGETKHQNRVRLLLVLVLLFLVLSTVTSASAVAQDTATVESGTHLFSEGRQAFERHEYDRAIEWFEKAVQLDEQNSDFHLWLGRAYGHQALRSHVLKQPFLALKVKEHFERAVELNPDNLAARADLQEYYEKAPGFLGGSNDKARQQAEEIARRTRQQVQR